MIKINIPVTTVDLGLLRWQILKIRIALRHHEFLSLQSLHTRDTLLTIANHLEHLNNIYTLKNN